MIFFAPEDIVFDEGQFYTVQDMASLPQLPRGKTAIGQGYNLFATSDAPVLTGSISFQYLGNDVLVEGAAEDHLTIHHWDGSRWQALNTYRDSYYNFASAASQGVGVYALLAGVTEPEVTAVIPSVATNDITNTLVISGGYFLPPLQVTLVGPTATYSLPLLSVSPYSITAVVSQGLQAREYQVVVLNGNQPGGAAVSNPGTFALFDPAEACFYDFFESGTSKWERDGEWAIAILPDGERAMTDSPTGTYNNAIPPAVTQTTAITSMAFSLLSCPNPVLAFRHDYVVDNRPPSQDVGRVEITDDGGVTWGELANYSGGGIFDLSTQDVEAPEWISINWQDIEISLNAYTGTIQLRFSLEVDQFGADKGWVIDNLRVMRGPEPGPLSMSVYLPVILKGK